MPSRGTQLVGQAALVFCCTLLALIIFDLGKASFTTAATTPEHASSQANDATAAALDRLTQRLTALEHHQGSLVAHAGTNAATPTTRGDAASAIPVTESDKQKKAAWEAKQQLALAQAEQLLADALQRQEWSAEDARRFFALLPDLGPQGTAFRQRLFDAMNRGGLKVSKKINGQPF